VRTPTAPVQPGPRTRRVGGGAASVPGSGIREIVMLAYGRDDVVHLEIGEPDFPTRPMSSPPATGHWPPATGTRRAPASPHSAGPSPTASTIATNCPDDPDRVVVSQGAVQGIAAALAVLVEPGDEGARPGPGVAKLRDADPAVRRPTGALPRLHPARDFRPDPAEVAALITPRTRVLVLNSPANPTGAVFGPR